MTDKAERDRLDLQTTNSGADVEPAPGDLERLRLRFELELLGSQDAGASLDPLLRSAEGNGHASMRDSADQA